MTSLSDTQIHLLRHLADGHFRSGADLAQRLGLTRAAVWKHIHALEGVGLHVHSVAGKGYRLAAPLDLLDRNTLQERIAPECWAQLTELQVHTLLDSTNAHLLRQGSAGIACLAEAQNAGRGRSGRHWVSPFAASIYLSLSWHFAEGPAVLGGLSLAVGVAAARALSRCGIGEIGLKWPNDLLWRQRKLGGVLIEVVGESHGPCRVVVGVGINGAVPAQAGTAIDQSWVDLAEVTGGRPPSRNQLAAGLIEELVTLLRHYPEYGLQAHLPEWRRLNCVLDRPVTLHLAERSLPGVARDITEDGLLVLDLEDGTRKAFAGGEVRLRFREVQ